MSRRRLQMRLVSIRGSMETEEKILCELMISVHRQTQEDRLLKEIPLCVGRIQNGQDRHYSLEVAANTVPSFLSVIPTPWSRHLERTRQRLNSKGIMSENTQFQPNESHFFPLLFILKFLSDHSWLPHLEWITTGRVIILRLLSLVFSVPSQACCFRCDCWRQPCRCGPRQRDLWGRTCADLSQQAHILYWW